MPTVREYMDDDPATVKLDTSAEDVAHLLGEHELPGVPVVNEAGRCVGIVTENDLVMADEEGDLHIPHYVELFGGLVFLESARGFEKRLKKAMAATAEDLMTADPTIAPDDRRARGRAADLVERPQPPPRGGARRARGRDHRADVLRALTA